MNGFFDGKRETNKLQSVARIVSAKWWSAPREERGQTISKRAEGTFPCHLVAGFDMCQLIHALIHQSIT